jgi:Sortase domain
LASYCEASGKPCRLRVLNLRLRARMSLALVAAGGLIAAGAALAGAQSGGERPYRAALPMISRAELPPPPPPTPTPRPEPYIGPVNSLYLESARIRTSSPIETGDTHLVGSREFLDDPRRPQNIMWYPRFGRPGLGGTNTIFAAHVNYIGYGNGPFAYLTSAKVDDALYVTRGDGRVLAYTVKSVVLVHLVDLDMGAVVYPPLDDQTERITLISCGGTFIPAAIGGEYTSRVILVAERFVAE